MGEFPTADSVTMSRHLKAREIWSDMTPAPLGDLSDLDLAPPPGIDASGRSAQTFLVEVVVRRGDEERSAVALGQDIYAITGPLLMEAARRLLERLGRAAAFLRSLGPETPALELA